MTEDKGLQRPLDRSDSNSTLNHFDPIQYSYVGNTLDRLDRDFLTQPHLVHPITADTFSEALRLTDSMKVDLGQLLKGEET